jgi:hypothetical protein
MPAASIRARVWLLCIALLAIAVAVVWWRAGASRDDVPASAAAPAPAPTTAAPARGGEAEAREVRALAATPPESAGRGAASPPPPGAAEPGTDPAAELGGSWENVDMEAVRRALPDNLYWKQGVFTQDPRVLREREEERARWNTEYGKVLSGTGTEDEIRAYFAYRHRLSADYVEFATYLLDHHRDDIPERDIGLLELARRMHLKRLEEMPRKMAEAFERKREQDAAREAWLAEEAELGAGREGEADPGE